MPDQNKNDYREEINRAIDAFCTASRENHTMFLDSQKLIIREMMHERREIEREAIENHKQEGNYQLWFTTIGTIVVLASLIVGFYVAVQQMNLSRLYKREGWLENTINNQNAKYEVLMSAMSTVRGIRAEGQLSCKNGQYAGPNPAAYQERLFTADYRLVSAVFAPRRMFGPEVFKKIVSFVYDSNGRKLGICAKGAPDEEVLRKQQDDINNLISSQIDQLEKEKSDVEDQIEGVENIERA